MKQRIETYKDSKLIKVEKVNIPEPELTPEQKEIQQLKDRVSALEAARYIL